MSAPTVQAKGKQKLAGDRKRYRSDDRLIDRLHQMQSRGTLIVEGQPLELTDDDLLMLQGVAQVETGGLTNEVTVDSAIISLGFFQATLVYGELYDVIKKVPDLFAKHQITIGSGYWDFGKSGGKQPKIEGVESPYDLKREPWLSRFFDAGNEDAVVAAMVKVAMARMGIVEKRVSAIEGRSAGGSTGEASPWMKDPTVRARLYEAYNNYPSAAWLAARWTTEDTAGKKLDRDQFLDIFEHDLVKAFAHFGAKKALSGEHIIKKIPRDLNQLAGTTAGNHIQARGDVEDKVASFPGGTKRHGLEPDRQETSGGPVGQADTAAAQSGKSDTSSRSGPQREPLLKLGSRGASVAELQCRLNELENAGSLLATDGIFGPLTRGAVVAFQRQHRPLVPDGIVGPRTRQILASAKPSGRASHPAGPAAKHEPPNAHPAGPGGRPAGLRPPDAGGQLFGPSPQEAGFTPQSGGLAGQSLGQVSPPPDLAGRYPFVAELSLLSFRALYQLRQALDQPQPDGTIGLRVPAPVAQSIPVADGDVDALLAAIVDVAVPVGMHEWARARSDLDTRYKDAPVAEQRPLREKLLTIDAPWIQVLKPLAEIRRAHWSTSERFDLRQVLAALELDAATKAESDLTKDSGAVREQVRREAGMPDSEWCGMFVMHQYLQEGLASTLKRGFFATGNLLDFFRYRYSVNWQRVARWIWMPGGSRATDGEWVDLEEYHESRGSKRQWLSGSDLRSGDPDIQTGDVVMITVPPKTGPQHIIMVDEYDHSTGVIVTVGGNDSGYVIDRSAGSATAGSPRRRRTTQPTRERLDEATGLDLKPGTGPYHVGVGEKTLSSQGHGSHVFGIGRVSLVDLEPHIYAFTPNRVRPTKPPSGSLSARP